MRIQKKLRDLFVVRKDGGKQLLSPGKRYIISRAGAIRELVNADTETFDQHAEDQNTLLMMGDRGDLRQLETIQRNLSVLFNTMVDVNELYDVTPSVQSPQVARSMTYDVGGIAFCQQVRISGTATQAVSFKVYGSNDDATWEQLNSVFTHTFTGTGVLETVTLPTDTTKYRYFKLIQEAQDIPEIGYNTTAIAGIVFVLKDRAVEKYFPKSETGALESLTSKVHDMSLYMAGAPTDGETLYKFVVPETMYVKADFAGFALSAGTLPTADYILTVQHNGSPIGTLTLDSAGILSFSSVARIQLNVRDRLSVVSGAANGAEDLSITFSFERGTTQ